MENDDFNYLVNSLENFLEDAGFTSTVKSVDDIDSHISVMATVGITGDRMGFLTISMNLENGIRLSQRFSQLMGIPIESNDFSDPHMEALSELSNQISGRVVMYMEENGTNCSITPPSLMSGGDISFSLKSMKLTRLFRVDGSYGFFYITIGLK